MNSLKKKKTKRRTNLSSTRSLSLHSEINAVNLVKPHSLKLFLVYFMFDICPSLLSVAVMNTVTKISLGRKAYTPLRELRAGTQAGTWTQELSRNQRVLLNGLLSMASLACFHRQWGLPCHSSWKSVKKICYRPVWGRCFLNWVSLSKRSYLVSS